MCLSCGCGEPNNAHGNQDHITMQTLERAAKAAKISPHEAADNIHQGVQQASGMSGQSQSGMSGQQKTGSGGMGSGQQGGSSGQQSSGMSGQPPKPSKS